MRLATLAPRGTVTHPLAADIRSVVHAAYRATPRHQQTRLGPSQIGEPCARRLAYGLMHHPAHNESADPWPSIVGTAVHSWLADAFDAANRALGRIRYLVEQRVEVRPGLEGSCDLYDYDTRTIIDHKVLGTTTLAALKQHGPGAGYRSQVHLYGVGIARLGLPVRHVAIAAYPRGGLLSGLHVWTEPWNPQIAQAALARHDLILETVLALDVDQYPDRYRLVPRTPGHHCTYCRWWRPGPDTGDGCPGNTAVPA